MLFSLCFKRDIASLTSEASSVVYQKNLSISGPARPGPCRRFLEIFISETVDLICIRSSQEDMSIQATSIKVGLDSFGGSPWQVARAA